MHGNLQNELYQNNNNLFAWSGLKQSDMAFSDKGFTGEFIHMLKKDICEIMKSFVTSTSISKKKKKKRTKVQNSGYGGGE